ncbi:transposase [Streptomyces sp. 11x1]|uniref:transposase n=1 Tax=Streptomyces sp. 11x1 TaxID=3038642 RepID=UPI002930D248|nr:transposase [Streptomyces sp. 11x1]WNZ12933.1 transposase [Streptomyces sp. 11x1]
MAHLLEVETGYRSGSRSWARPGEPRGEYDPERTTLTERRRAKVAELQGLDRQEAKQLGLEWISERTLERMAAKYDEHGVMGLADGRWTPPLRGRWAISEEVAEAIRAVHAESLHRSKVSMKTKERMIHQYVREKFEAKGKEVDVPHYTTLAKVWKEWFGTEGARQRYIRSAAAVETGKAKVVILRPGQVVVLDTTPLPVKVLDDVFGTPISVHLTLALDAYSHSLVAFRLTPVSDSSVEVAMLLRDVLLPLPMRPDWGEELEWPYPGVPAALVAEFAGYRVAGLPFFAPETVTSDHGSIYKNHQIVHVARTLKMELLPARAMRPTDKAACERAFAGIQSLLLELLLGYQGVDVADRGVDPEGDAVWTLAEMEHLLATWIVAVWQNRKLDQYAPAWDPGGRHSPNTLFAAAAARDGISLEIPEPNLYFELLPAHSVKIDRRRGVKIGGLWYGGTAPVLDPYRGQRSARSGRHAGKWAISRDPRDCRYVYFEDPEQSGLWHALSWNGLPPGDDVPAFSDARVREVLREAVRAGLKPRDDKELLPVLLKLVASRTPVTAWPTQMTIKQRSERARELARARSAASDRPAAPLSELPPPARPADLAAAHRRAVTADRQRRREAGVSQPPTAPPLLGEALRARNLFVLPDEEEVDNAGQAEEPGPESS